MTGNDSILSPTTRSVLASLGTATVYDLGLEIGRRMPHPRGEAFVPFSLAFSTTAGGSAPGADFQFAGEVIVGSLHTSTHIDALIHVQSKDRVHGGMLERDARTDRGFLVHGAETIAPIVTRGVLLDIAGHRGVEQLPAGYEVGVDDVTACLEDAGVVLVAGDAVLVRTGKVREFDTHPDTYHDNSPGIGLAAAVWLVDHGTVVVGTDTWGTEPMPFRNQSETVHVALLVERGIPLVENLDLERPAAAGVTVGLFVCLPLKLTGATGSWVRPILIA